MSEVSCRAVIPIVEAIREMGQPVDGLFEGLPFSLEYISGRQRRISWDDYLVLLERGVSILGGVGHLESVIRRLPKKMGIMRAIGVDLMSMRMIYKLGTTWYGPSLFLNARATFEDVPDGRVREVVEILPQYRDSELYFHVVHAFLSGAPAVLGAKDVEVEMELQPRRAVYTITLPPEPTFQQKLRAFFSRRSVQKIAAEELLAVNQEIRDCYVRSREDHAALAGKSRVLGTLNRTGQALMRHAGIGELAKGIVEIIDREFDFGGVALFSATPEEYEFELISQAGRTVGEPSRSCLLKVGVTVVGRLDLWKSDFDEGAAQEELLEGLLLWFAVALNNVQTFETRARQTARLKVEIATRRRVEERLNRVRKMEALGNLASSVAHDFNNTLAAVHTYAELAQQCVTSENPVARELEGILAAADRGAGLIKQILAFTRKEAVFPEHVDLNSMIGALAPMLRQLVGDDIEVETQLGEPLGIVMADPMKIEQVIINLIVNSRDAMPEGGRVTIRTSNVGDDRPDVTDHGYVKLEVIDTGCGIDKELQSQIFEPFFTTKQHGEGTGLGLAILHGTVTQSGGSVEVQSEPGNGTHFIIRLPRVGGRVEPERVEEVQTESDGGWETVLLVEDDEHFRSGTRRSLAAKGYRVLTAVDGEEALAVCESHREPIDLLLTDVGLPGLDGHELARRAELLRPELRGVVYISGFPDPELAQGRPPPEGQVFLSKPFTRFALLSTIRRLLDD